MLKNYIKIAWRSLTKNKVSSFINISGLAVGLAISILIMTAILDMISYDKFHKNLPNLYSLMKSIKVGGDIGVGTSVPVPLAPDMRANIPEIKHISRLATGGNALLNTSEKGIYENAVFVEPDYFRMMTFPALVGDPVKAMEQPGSVVITERTAIKLFGKANAIGQLINYNNQIPLQVAAVIKDIPENSSQEFDVAIPFSVFEQQNLGWIHKWDNNQIATWLELQPTANLTAVNEKLAKLIQARLDDKEAGLFAYPFADVWLYGDFQNGKPSGGRIYAVYLFGIIGIFVLLVACVNFMNLSTARSERRAREVGVRKVMGAMRKQVIIQFLCEAMLLAVISLVLGLLLARIALPMLNYFTEKEMQFDFTKWQLWVSLLAMVLFTGLVAGSYPAFFLSSFKPVLVLKGIIGNRQGGSALRKGLVTFQFMISIFLIIATIVIYKQLRHAENRPIGYEASNLLEIPLRGEIGNKYALLSSELKQVPGVVSVSGGGNNLINFGGATDGISWPGRGTNERMWVTLTDVQYGWVKTAGLTMAEGREFDPAYGTDSNAVLLNEVAVKKMRLKSPVVGTRVGGSTVIGVVKDFVYNSPLATPKPMYIKLTRAHVNHLFVRITNDDQWQGTVDRIEQAIKKVDSQTPFRYHFVGEQFQKRLKGIRYTSQFTNLVGILAIFISCLGLFGLSAFLAERRQKEIGVRKVLGANVAQVWLILSKDFLKPVMAAFLLAAPLAGWALHTMLQNWDYRISLAWWMFAVAGLTVTFIAVATVSFHGIRAALVKPSASLRSE
ncbi:ABC transporter permease [Paraflavitalea sp. CAU 1676]|uniref:ABC transporter permease n=1 Tax=Paraflavitalea sp. CAU 1676 TaxID=3032598 RepID=UPI0023DCAF19|nr:ABC transporter permease [Paraflavitalea sp. CAU 1676]MDF2188163.1 ABC transporter permease [Paraflavitalea sp. CAU 1676]